MEIKPLVLCAFCPRPAESVCNLSAPAFKGCNKPFCSLHGILHLKQLNPTKPDRSSSRSSLTKEVYEVDNPVLFRACITCQAQRRKEWTLKYQKIFAAIALSLALLTGVLGVMTSIEKEACSPASIVTISDRRCILKRPLEEYEHLAWFKFQNGGVDCSLLMNPQSRDEVGWAIRCTCSPAEQGGMRVFKNERIALQGLCEPVVCPPNGTAWVDARPECRSSTAGSANEPLGQCPPGTLLFHPRNVCMKPSCKTYNYYKEYSNSTCRRCPLFSYGTSGLGCRRLRFSGGNVNHFVNIERASGKPIACPPEPWELSLLQEKSLLENGYYPRIIDEFGYWQCPSKKGPGQQRTCAPEEMVIKYTLGCTSPCSPCLEKWDFALKKCVAADSNCSSRGLRQRLTSSGECNDKSVATEQYILKFGEYFCE